MQPALDLRTSLLEQGCSFTAEVEAHVDEQSYDFTLECVCTPEGETRLRVVQPENIADIRATVSADGQSVEFSDVGLSMGLLADEQIAPIALPQMLYSCWTSQYISEAGVDGEQTTAVYLVGYGDDKIAVEQWISGDQIPSYADFWFHSENIASVTVTDFLLGEAQPPEAAQ